MGNSEALRVSTKLTLWVTLKLAQGFTHRVATGLECASDMLQLTE